MDKKKTSKKLTTLLIDSFPDEDSFRHSKISDAIFEFIQDEEKGGKAIALSGGFGSGKSTVIEFLQQRFEKEEKKNKNKEDETKIFTFDAWEHQGDPLRRAFIEELVEFLENNKWIDKGEFEDELEKISKRKEEIETETEPIVSKEGGWFAFLLLLIPLGLSLVRYGTIDVNLFWVNMIGFILILSPLVYVLYLLASFDEKKRKSVFNLFFKKTKENIKSKSLKTPEPTTIEFQNVFNKIASKALSVSNRRFIIVVDNIDRLTTTASINAWTTLRTFFDNGKTKKWGWTDQFWLMVPFDFNELKKLWSGLDHLKGSESNSKLQNASEYVHAFIDKTFQITFRIPRPVLSDWKSYFQKQLKKAFTSEKEKNLFNDITTIYQLKGLIKESPTPRDIKQFINLVSASYRIWEGKIDLRTIAYYELIARIEEEEQIVEKLKNGELVDDTFRSLIKEERINRKLAAIHFNCDIEKANQVLFGNQVVSALREGKAKELEDYLDTEGFLDVIDSEFYTINGERIPQSLANSALCFKEIEEKSDHNFGSFYSQLSVSFEQINNIKPFNEKIGNGIVTIWEKTGYPNEWITSILEKVSKTELKEEETIKNWFSLLRPILIEINKRGKTDLLTQNLVIPGGVKEFIEFMVQINKLDKDTKFEIAKKLVPASVEEQQFVSTYTSLLNSNEVPDDLGATLYLLTKSEKLKEAKNWNWGNLVNQIKDKVQINTSARPEQVEAALIMILVLHFKLNKKGAVQLAGNQHFRNGLFFLLNTSKEEKIIPLLLLSSILFNPENQKSNDNNVNKGYNILNIFLEKPEDKNKDVNAILNYLLEYSLIDKFIEVQQGVNHLQKLSNVIISKVFDSNIALHHISADLMFKYFNNFHNAVDEEKLRGHIRLLYKQNDIVTQIIEKTKTVPANYQLHYFFALECPEKERESYFEFLIQGFQSIETNEWLTHIEKNSLLIQLAIFIQNLGYNLNLSINFRDALEEHYKKLYEGKIEQPVKSLKDDWGILLNGLEDDVRETFLNNIVYFIENKENGLVSSIGNLYDQILIKEGIYKKETGRFISTVFSRILKKDNETELKWLKDLIQSYPAILKQDKSATSTFKKEVAHVNLENYSSEAQDEIKGIAIELKVKIKGDVEED